MLLIFVPGCKALSAQVLADHKLDRLIESPQCRETYLGPGGQQGLLIADGSMTADSVAFDKAKQIWSPRFGYSSLIGHWKDARPTPADLQRDKIVPGADVNLLHKTTWHIPTLRSWQPGDTLRFETTLPRIMQQSPDTGQWMLTDVIPEFQPLWQLSRSIADQLMDQLRGNTAASLDSTQLFSLAIDLLAVNYRMDASLASHLQLLEPSMCSSIVQVALDWGTLRAHLKNLLSRQRSGGTSTESGATPPTGD